MDNGWTSYSEASQDYGIHLFCAIHMRNEFRSPSDGFPLQYSSAQLPETAQSGFASGFQVALPAEQLPLVEDRPQQRARERRTCSPAPHGQDRRM